MSKSDPHPETETWRLALAALLPRRGLGRLLVGALGLTGIAGAAFRDDALAKKKKKKKKKAKTPTPVCTPDCSGGKNCGSDGCDSVCGTCDNGFVCSDLVNGGVCECASDVVCDDTCCGDADDVCDGTDACCSPEPQNQTCAGKCGTVDNTCDEPVNCGACQPQTCQIAACLPNKTCDYDDSPDNQSGENCDAAGEFCCQGDCCSNPQVCFGGACCTPETQNQTCQGRCGPTTNTCGQVVACGGCGGAFVCSDLVNGGVCACPAPRVECAGGDVCCAAGQVCAAASDTCSVAYQFVTQWGGLSACDGQPQCDEPQFNGKFNKPSDLAFDEHGDVYVMDWDNERVQKFRQNGVNPQQYDFVTKWGEAGLTEDHHLSTPYGIEVAENGIVYVVDYSHNRVQRFAPNGTNPLQYDFLDNWGGFGDDPGQFNNPVRIASDSDGNLFVSDSSNHRVQKFDSIGTPLLAFGGFGSGPAQLKQPSGIGVDSNDDVYVVDYGNHRIQKFSNAGAPVTRWGSLGDRAGEFIFPQGIAVDGFDDIYVADTNNHRIQKFEQDSVDPLQYNWVTTFGSFGQVDPGRFVSPVGVAVDDDDNVYVADTYNHRIQKFAPVAEAALLRAGGRFRAERDGRDQGRKRERRRRHSRNHPRNQDQSQPEQRAATRNRNDRDRK